MTSELPAGSWKKGTSSVDLSTGHSHWANERRPMGAPRQICCDAPLGHSDIFCVSDGLDERSDPVRESGRHRHPRVPGSFPARAQTSLATPAPTGKWSHLATTFRPEALSACAYALSWGACSRAFSSHVASPPGWLLWSMITAPLVVTRSKSITPESRLSPSGVAIEAVTGISRCHVAPGQEASTQLRS